MTNLLQIDHVGVSFSGRGRPVHAVIDASLSVESGEIVGIVGESGSGKTSLCAAINRSLPDSAVVTGEIRLSGRSLFALSESEMRAVRGRDIGMILQNPMTSLDPLFTIGSQLREVIAERRRSSKSRAMTPLEAVRRVHIADPEERLGQYPHQMSGGMKQRVLIAMTTSGQPSLLIADEPITALDATIQEEILVLFKEILGDRTQCGVLIVTHDLNVVRRISDRVVVMYAGRIVEEGPTHEIFSSPRHPYTAGLIRSIPRLRDGQVTMSNIPGQVPRLDMLPPGCAFADRCAFAIDACRSQIPPNKTVGPGHSALCLRSDELHQLLAVTGP